jgi:hypothetical protein
MLYERNECPSVARRDGRVTGKPPCLGDLLLDRGDRISGSSPLSGFSNVALQSHQRWLEEHPDRSPSRRLRHTLQHHGPPYPMRLLREQLHGRRKAAIETLKEPASGTCVHELRAMIDVTAVLRVRPLAASGTAPENAETSLRSHAGRRVLVRCTVGCSGRRSPPVQGSEVAQRAPLGPCEANRAHEAVDRGGSSGEPGAA